MSPLVASGAPALLRESNPPTLARREHTRQAIGLGGGDMRRALSNHPLHARHHARRSITSTGPIAHPLSSTPLRRSALGLQFSVSHALRTSGITHGVPGIDLQAATTHRPARLLVSIPKFLAIAHEGRSSG